jgi:hypothetical protein
MSNILADAQEYKRVVYRLAKAHYVSAEYHRHRAMVLGTITTTATT